jgi:hypothetical protein
VWDFPEPCTPQTTAENGAFYQAKIHTRPDYDRIKQYRVDVKTWVVGNVDLVLQASMYSEQLNTLKRSLISRYRNRASKDPVLGIVFVVSRGNVSIPCENWCSVNLVVLPTTVVIGGVRIEELKFLS